MVRNQHELLIDDKDTRDVVYGLHDTTSKGCLSWGVMPDEPSSANTWGGAGGWEEMGLAQVTAAEKLVRLLVTWGD